MRRSEQWIWGIPALLLAVSSFAEVSGPFEPSVCRIRDPGAVTQVDAPGKREAFYCWGLIHARERGRQMQVLRQTGRGRLAEERGPEFLKGDFTLRLMELEPRAARVTSQIPTDDRLLLDAYASGVNDGNSAIFSADRWKAADTVLLLLLQSFDQTRRSFEQDILTDQHAREGHPLQRDFPWDTPILKKGEYPERGGSSHAGPPAAPRPAPCEE